MTVALSSCLRAGRSELVARQNSDLELHHECLAELVGALAEHPRARVAGKLLDHP